MCYIAEVMLLGEDFAVLNCWGRGWRLYT